MVTNDFLGGIMKKIFKVLSCMLLVFILASCSNNNDKNTSKNENEKVLRVGVTAQYKPWCYKKGNEITGIDPEILQEVGKRMGGYKIEYSVASFEGMFGLLDAGKVDTVAQQITITEKRKEKYIFSEVYAYNPYKLQVRQDSNIKSLEDMKGKTMQVQPAGVELELMNKYKKKNDPNNEIKLLITEGSSSEIIESKKADASIYPVGTFEQVKEEAGFKTKLVGPVLFEEKNAYPFNKNTNPEVIKKFNEAIKSMKEDGTLKSIYEKNIKLDVSKSSGDNTVLSLE